MTADTYKLLCDKTLELERTFLDHLRDCDDEIGIEMLRDLHDVNIMTQTVTLDALESKPVTSAWDSR